LILLEIEGITRAWDFVLEQNEKGHLSLTPAFLQKTHALGFAWIFPDMGGKYRKIEVQVSDYEPPKFYRVPQLMLDFCEDLKVRIKHLPKENDEEFLSRVIELLAWAHHRFLWIHPFQDYNGRIGRLLINIILLKLNLPPVELKAETKTGRKKYIEALQAADEGDYKALEKRIASALREAAKGLS
jgi:cell filamentation protein